MIKTATLWCGRDYARLDTDEVLPGPLPEVPWGNLYPPGDGHGKTVWTEQALQAYKCVAPAR